MVEVPKAAKTSLKEKIMGTQPIKQQPTQNFTSNSALNDLLNETAQGDTNTQTATAPSIAETNMPDPVAKVVNRDYRSLMQAIDKKKNR
jgi:hypothetical protein